MPKRTSYDGGVADQVGVLVKNERQRRSCSNELGRVYAQGQESNSCLKGEKPDRPFAVCHMQHVHQHRTPGDLSRVESRVVQHPQVREDENDHVKHGAVIGVSGECDQHRRLAVRRLLTALPHVARVVRPERVFGRLACLAVRVRCTKRDRRSAALRYLVALYVGLSVNILDRQGPVKEWRVSDKIRILPFLCTPPGRPERNLLSQELVEFLRDFHGGLVFRVGGRELTLLGRCYFVRDFALDGGELRHVELGGDPLGHQVAADAHVLGDVLLGGESDHGAGGFAARNVVGQATVSGEAEDGSCLDLHGDQSGGAGKSLLLREGFARGGNGVGELLAAGDTVFGLEAELGHDLDTVHRVLAAGGFARKHDTVSTVQNSVDDIGRLSPGRPGVVDHGLEHLGGGDDGLGGFVALPDHVFLRDADLLDRDFHTEVTPGNHDTIGFGEDGVEVAQTLHVLDLGDDLDVLAGFAQHAPALFDVVSGLSEGQGDEVEVVGDGELLDVVDVLLAEDGKVNLDTGEVHVLLLADGGVVENLDDDVVAELLHDLTGEATVGNEDPAANLHGLSELGVRARNALVVALVGVVGGDLKGLAVHEVDGLVLLEETGSDLRSLGVEHKTDVGVRALLHGTVYLHEHLLLRLVVSV
ncbi:hypothetical protein BOVATA_003720 [Babesia ovata]|uniref:Uncharacterized protein n=1 Tax=Babesia ovata TaxID=189622 RepID=A0A2H6K7E7_9APIC|nr:uncharacterized protein BOVATA_003720 [Babesia ovata]GBE58879.1 hypothetical protein BOVATA_003720 [Babesia ovata]